LKEWVAEKIDHMWKGGGASLEYLAGKNRRGPETCKGSDDQIMKIYAESFRAEKHLKRIQEEAMAIVEAAYKEASV